MDYGQLQRHIRELASLEQSDELVVSCYINAATNYRKTFQEQVSSAKNMIERKLLPGFWEALGRIEVFFGTGIRAESRGVAVFARGGEPPFFLSLQFGAPLPNSLKVGFKPHLDPLIHLRENYYRQWSTEERTTASVGPGTIH